MRALRSVLLAAALATAFAVAAQAHHVATVVTTNADVRRAADLVRDAIADHRLVLLGEMHGTQEAPALAGALLDCYVAQHRPVVLALEINTNEQPRFDRYLASHVPTRTGRHCLPATRGRKGTTTVATATRCSI